MKENYVLAKEMNYELIIQFYKYFGSVAYE